jgi:hypothetical protein
VFSDRSLPTIQRKVESPLSRLKSGCDADSPVDIHRRFAVTCRFYVQAGIHTRWRQHVSPKRQPHGVTSHKSLPWEPQILTWLEFYNGVDDKDISLLILLSS